MRATANLHFRAYAEMQEVFKDFPEALKNTLAIAERCDVSLAKGEYHLPNFDVPAGYELEGYFRKVVREGFERRSVRWNELKDAGALRVPLETYETRLRDEMDMICRMKFPAYFLIVWDFIRYARENGVPVGPGRGSAAGSLVAYCLGITDIDPLPYNLIFERFLNPERVSMPDIDIDFCMRKRGQVIDYVTRKYGRDRVAQIITFGTMAARAVIRDAGRGLDISYGEVDRIAKLVPAELDATLDKAMATVPQLREAYEKDPKIKRLIDVGRRLEGLTRHASTHAAGVVISPSPITDFAPLYQAGEGEITTQYAMESIERIGLLKMDFLGLKTLTLIEDILDRLKLETGTRTDLERLPLDDPETYRLFSEARTSGVFQFESAGMKDILARLKPTRFEDLIALNALYRPGPIKGGLIDDFIKRRHGKIKVAYPHAILEPILKDTYGVIVYQEQVMQIASAMAGYTLGEADILRRAMGKKKKEAMAAERDKFVEGARVKKIAEKIAGEVFDLMEHFAGYGFNASHSAAYALIAYRTAFLKAHHPRQFMAALLSIEKETTDNVAKYVQECREMGIQVLPPDINESQAEFSVEGEAIRYGLAAIKKVGEAAVESIVSGRSKVGRYVSMTQVAAEVDARLVNKGVVEALVKAGAFDGLGVARARLAVSLDGAFDAAQRHARAKASGQVSLFGGDEGESPVLRDVLPADVEEWPERDRLSKEREALGFYLTGHPLSRHLEDLKGLATHTTGSLHQAPQGAEVAVGGMIAGVSRKKTRKGETMAIFNLEDLEGGIEVIAFPDLYARSQAIFLEETPVLVTGKAEADETRVRIIASELMPLSEALRSRTGSIHLRVPVSGVTEETHGACPVYLELTQPGSFALTLKADVAWAANPSHEMVASLEALLGPGSVRLKSRSGRPSAGRRAQGPRGS
jgi:DNA polymerase-3 subunit alpha